jgi:long-chain acyl-CoA synthetase
MQENPRLTIPSLFKETVKKFGNRNALTMVGESPITYSEVKEQIDALIAFLEKLHIRQGDKVAILSTNIPAWGITYLGLTSMGAVVVPLLPDFHPNEIHTILEHSETKAIFISTGLVYKLDGMFIDAVETMINIEDYSVISMVGPTIAYDSAALPTKEFNVEENDLASIIYTSGTTGKSKGVMLSHKNICFTAQKSGVIQPIDENDRFLSVLPLAHSYENTIGFMLPMLFGACVYYLGKPPTPSILLPALEEVKPTLMLTVPMIIEKIYRNKILPAFNANRVMRSVYKVPFFRKKLNVVAGRKLMKTFGGKIHFFGIGGAKLDSTVEQFLIEAKFPYAIGYGLTESAPLLAGFNPSNAIYQSTGPAMEGVTLKINNPDTITGEGEIWAKGPNVMLGYYKQPTLTGEMITPDGWLKTGDLGMFDEKQNLYIRGRIKNVIIGPSGENIYPEEIESVINNFQYVVESLVIEKKGKLVAMVHFNIEEIAERYKELKETGSNYIEAIIEELLRELQQYVNSRVNKFSRLQIVVAQTDPFQKTATQKIKRFLYTA